MASPEYEFPSVRAFLIGTASSELVSLWNEQKFFTKDAEFTAIFLVLCCYCIYLWMFGLVQRGYKMSITENWPSPTKWERFFLVCNICGFILAIYWIAESFLYGVVAFNRVEIAVFSAFCGYWSFMMVSTSQGGWNHVGSVLQATVFSPRLYLLEQVVKQDTMMTDEFSGPDHLKKKYKSQKKIDVENQKRGKSKSHP